MIMFTVFIMYLQLYSMMYCIVIPTIILQVLLCKIWDKNIKLVLSELLLYETVIILRPSTILKKLNAFATA